MNCPYCDCELDYQNYFGYLAAHQDGKILGDTYKCCNEECDAYEQRFYTYRHRPDDLHEGYPC